MKVPINYDPRKGAPSFEKGTSPEANPGIQPPKSIPDTPGENAVNENAEFSQNKAQPYGAGGSGYTAGH